LIIEKKLKEHAAATGPESVVSKSSASGPLAVPSSIVTTVISELPAVNVISVDTGPVSIVTTVESAADVVRANKGPVLEDLAKNEDVNNEDNPADDELPSGFFDSARVSLTRSVVIHINILILLLV
jgi:hypothetical protein